MTRANNHFAHAVVGTSALDDLQAIKTVSIK